MIINPREMSSICDKCPVRRSCVTKGRIPNCSAQFFDVRGVNWNAALKAVEGAGSASTNNAREEILQALARGYCHPKNSSKVLDSDLIFAMADELAKLSPVA